MKPVISIIVPVYNTGMHLEKCLDSILSQTFTNIEVIVVNDGSTDQSAAICDRYAKADKRVKVVHKEHGGVSSSRNIGVELATGEYIGFVDGDDYIKEAMYEMLYELCIETNSHISVCKMGRKINGELINKKNDKLYTKEMDNQEAMRELFIGILYRFSLCNKLFHKSCFENIQFPEGRIHEDLATTYKLFANADKAAYINYLGYVYVKRENSILTTRFSEQRMDSFIGWNEIIEFMDENYAELSDNVYSRFGYWCVDNVYYILNQVEVKQDKARYLEGIQKSVKNSYKGLLKTNLLSYKYKYIVTLLRYSTRLLLLSYNLNKVVFKKWALD